MGAWITAVLLLGSAVVRACRDHRHCHHSAWCDRAGSCVPCASWRWGNQSASITGSAPEHCASRRSAPERSARTPHVEHASRIPHVEHANRISQHVHVHATSLVLPHYVSMGLNNYKMELRRDLAARRDGAPGTPSCRKSGRDPQLGTLLIGTHTWVNHLRGPQDVARGPPDGIPPYFRRLC